ncbi:uncharacterized protein LOC113289406 [Papaver somniferum]|uniref:uncharacterized protein LOC113289406 n=1 Tax=Papaver somniferum TaxID=3469 RepID=UPI000E6FF8A3|nr:uncharacterized protein LOC113289406 [Papaver somniferum]
MEEMNSKEGNSTNPTPISDLICDSNSQTPIPDDVGSQMFKSISRGIEEESLDFEVVPSFLFEEKENSIPTVIDEEDDLDLELIPPFFFDENEDDDSLNGMSLQFEEVSKQKLISFSKLNQVKIDKVNNSSPVLFNNFEKNFDNLKCLREFFILDNKVNGINYFYLHLNDVRPLFDRGKYVIVLSISYENLVNIWIPSLGYQSDFQYTHLIVSSCVNSVEIHGETKVFVQMSEKGKIVLARIVSFDMAYQLIVQMLVMRRELILLLQLKCGLSHEKTVLQLNSLDSVQIPLDSIHRVFKFVFKFVSFDTLLNILHGSLEFQVLQPWILLYYIFLFCGDHGSCFCRHLKVTDIPATRMYAYVVQFLNPASNFVLLHCYFRMRTNTIIGDCSRLSRMDVFLPYPMPTSVIYGSVATLGEGMQVYRYSADVHSRFYARHKSYSLYRLLSLIYQTMEVYIKFQFYVRVLETHRWFTVDYTLHALRVEILLSCE